MGGKYIKGVWLRLRHPKSIKWPISFPLSIRRKYFNQEPSAPPGINERFYLDEDKYLIFYFGGR